jgi:CRISPR system Cascade subunit CasB
MPRSDLYAMHQQSRTEPMHLVSAPGDFSNRRSIGAACRELRIAYTRENRPADGLDRRFRAAATASTVSEVAWHLRGLIQLLREKKIPLDYVQLAADLAGWPDPDRRARARRRWGLDYHRVNTPSEQRSSQ